MNRASLVATFVATLVATLVARSETASAGYIGLGIGSQPALSEQDQVRATSRSGKLLAGSRWGRFSLEGAIGRFGIGRAAPGSVEFGDAYQLSLSGKLNLPLGNNFEAFGRVGLAHTWLDASEVVFRAEGNGFLVGAGIEYRLDVGVAGASVFFDYQVNQAEMKSDYRGYDLTTRMFSIGATVGF